VMKYKSMRQASLSVFPRNVGEFDGVAPTHSWRSHDPMTESALFVTD